MLLSAGEATAASGDNARGAALAETLGRDASVAVHRETGAVRFAGSRTGDPIAQSTGGSPATVAQEFLERFDKSFGLAGGDQDLLLLGRTDDASGTTVRLQQTHGEIPVLGGEFVVNLDRSNDVVSVSGEALPAPDLELTPSVGESAATAEAREAVGKAHEVSAATLTASEPELWIYDSRILGGPGLERPRLVWRTEVTGGTGGDPIDELVLVDAHLGTVALNFSQVRGAVDRRVCDANNTSSEFPCVSPLRAEGGPATGIADVDAAYDYMGDTYDFYFDRFGRDGIDGAGLPMRATVRFCFDPGDCPMGGAFNLGDGMAVFGEDLAIDDVVGHEYTHSVTEFSSHLMYYFQSGAIDESFADVFGEYVDLTNGTGLDTPAVRWRLGEDFPPASGIGITDLADPPASLVGPRPDRMSSQYYTADPFETDYGGVHTNNSVGNKAAYLITDGDTFNGETVTGLGLDKAAQILYRVNTSYLSSASDYADLYTALPRACTDLIGSFAITAADCGEVADAVDATEMNLEPPVARTPQASTCATGETPLDIFFDDLEDPGAGNWNHSADIGPDAWSYPAEPVPLGIPGPYATSGTQSLWGNDQGTLSDSSIAMASPVSLPQGAFLRFNHAFGFEDFGGTYDGGVIEYSTNGGATWKDAGGLVAENGYNGTVLPPPLQNAIAGREAFVRESNGYISSRLDLSSLAGEEINLRFRIGTDGATGDFGWFIDDLRIYTCAKGATSNPGTPETTITAAKVNRRNRRARFRFEGSGGSGALAFECNLDGKGYEPCWPAKRYRHLRRGGHTFAVRSKDAEGSVDPTPAVREFRIRR
jgi:Zn-dependent metalloprotease